MCRLRLFHLKALNYDTLTRITSMLRQVAYSRTKHLFLYNIHEPGLQSRFFGKKKPQEQKETQGEETQ